MHLQSALERRLDDIASFASRDFCPWANRYVYWLKEPVGWFVVALAVSILVGFFLSPLGWTVAAGLFVIILLGLGFPWLVTRTVACELRPVNMTPHERVRSQLELKIRNHLPIPILGLMVEGYLTEPLIDNCDGDGDQPDVGLACVPALSEASYRLSICPEYRGTYPKHKPKIACAFPFGIWTARRSIGKVTSVTVRPMLIPITAELEFSGSRISHVGRGDRPTTNGEFLGVRDFRRGDLLKSIHWVQSARNDRLIVCERGGPQQQAVELKLSTTGCDGSAFEMRENLAWRVRIAASLVDMLVSRHLSFRLNINGKILQLPEGNASRNKAWDLLSEVPLDVPVNEMLESETNVTGIIASSCIVISATTVELLRLPSNQIRVEVQHPSSGIRGQALHRSFLLDLDDNIAGQLNHLLSEAAHANHAA